ncbi:MAG: tetratricopeptide repeat protein [Candidatus Thorarchaeota archaeon]
MPEDEQDIGQGLRPKHIGLLAIAVVVGGIVVAVLAARGILPVDPATTLGMSILIGTIIICCGSSLTLTSFASKIPEYSEMETEYSEIKEQYDAGDYEGALEGFLRLAGPNKDHIRAVYYAARCYEKMNDWDNVKTFCRAYLKRKPKDREVWELLATAHKRLFEYEEADRASQRAARL